MNRWLVSTQNEGVWEYTGFAHFISPSPQPTHNVSSEQYKRHHNIPYSTDVEIDP